MFIVLKRRSILFFVMAVLIAITGVVSLGEISANTVVSASVTDRQLPIYSVSTEEKKIALTFDAAWGADDTQDIIDILAKYEVKATFFLVGFWVDKFPSEVKALYDAGHEIGTHSNAHKFMSKMTKDEIISDINSSIDKISAVIGERAKVFRPPYGDYNNTLISTVRSLDLEPIQWSIDSLDWKGLSGAELISRVTSRLHPGGIILCHNNSEHIVEALGGIIEYALDNGYLFTTVSELIVDGEYYIDNNGVQHARTEN